MTTEPKVPNAEKWTEKEVKENLSCIRCWINHSEQNIFMGKALWRLGLYPDIWAYWKRKFASHDEMMEEMGQIEYILECRLAEAALFKEVSAPMAMFILRCKYGWKDKSIEAAKPKEKEAEKPKEKAAETAPEAPQAPTDAGNPAIEDTDQELTEFIQFLPHVDHREDEYKHFSPLTVTVKELAAAG